MCLAIPAKVTRLDADRLAEVDILGVQRQISLDLTPQANVGDYVLVHAGFAIEVVDEQFAQETIDLIREFPELAAEDLSAEASGGIGISNEDNSTGTVVHGASLAMEFAAEFGDVPKRGE